MEPSRAASAIFPWSVVPEPAAGEKRTGFLRWRDPVLQGWELPYYAIRGAAPGRAVAIVAAIHGGEYPGILGALRLAKMLQPERVRGSLLILPIVNLPAFWGRSAFVTPLDGRNLNRVFPGNAAGTFSDVLAHRLMEDIVGPADALIDLHSGDVFESLADHTACYSSGDPELDTLTRSMCEAFGLPIAISYPRPASIGTLTGNAVLTGTATALVEVGGNGLASDDDVFRVFQGLINALRALGVLGGLIPPAEVRWHDPVTRITAPSDGLWRTAVAAGQQVQPGDTLGTISDVFGNELTRFTLMSEMPGIVLYHMSALAVRSGDPLVYVSAEC